MAVVIIGRQAEWPIDGMVAPGSEYILWALYILVHKEKDDVKRA
jgi:hypothetical protein